MSTTPKLTGSCPALGRLPVLLDGATKSRAVGLLRSFLVDVLLAIALPHLPIGAQKQLARRSVWWCSTPSMWAKSCERPFYILTHRKPYSYSSCPEQHKASSLRTNKQRHPPPSCVLVFILLAHLCHWTSHWQNWRTVYWPVRAQSWPDLIWWWIY